MRIRHCEIAILGGGLAGSALAATLARAGRDVVLLEKSFFPRDKLCGEFLSPESSRLLEELECLEDLRVHDPAEIHHARFSVPPRRSLKSLLDVALPAPALGVSRRVLDACLFEAAGRHGAQTICGANVRSVERSKSGAFTTGVRFRPHPNSRVTENLTVQSRLVVAAYGRRTHLDHALHRPMNSPSASQLVAFKQHHRPQKNAAGDALQESLRNCVEIHTFEGGYCGLNFVESGTVNVCTLFDNRLLRGLKTPRWSQISELLSAQNSHLARRLRALVPEETPTQAVAQISLTLKERHREGVLFIGDAASMIAPLVGDGQAMALESGMLLGELILQKYPKIPTRAWEWQWRRNFEMRLRLGQGLQQLSLQPALAAGALELAVRWPGLTNFLVRRTRG